MIPKQLVERLRALSEPVPVPARLPTAAEVAAAEAELGRRFHPDLRQYLLELSDVVFGALEPVTLTSPDSHTHLATVCDDAWEGYDVPRELLPFCEDNADFYCLTEAGAVVFWSHDGETEERWPILAAWIEQVWIEEQSEDDE
jgi:hypothetical protein